MAGTIAPWIFQQFFDDNGNPASGYQLFTYVAGTTTKQPTYYDVDLSVANSNPIVLNSAGVATMYLVPGTVYDFVLAVPSDTDPPTGATRSRTNVAGIPESGTATNVTGTVGADVVLGNMLYLSDGTGGRTPGRWYLTDANTAAYSSSAATLGMATGTIASGESGTITLLGQVAGLSSLAAGTTYYLDTTPGALTASPPAANVRPIGVADSNTSIVLSQWVTTPEANESIPGIVGIGAQAFGGEKTFADDAHFASDVLGSGAIMTTGDTFGFDVGAGGAVTQATSKSTGVELNTPTGSIEMHNATLTAGTAVTFTLTNSMIYGAFYVPCVSIQSGATAGAYLVSVDAVAVGSCAITLRNLTAGDLGEAVVLSFVILAGQSAA